MNCPNCNSDRTFPYRGERPNERACTACGRVFTEDCKPMTGAASNKYVRQINGVDVDVYDILHAFNVTNPGDQHAIKKLLMPGQRGHKDSIKDRIEALEAIERAIALEETK